MIAEGGMGTVELVERREGAFRRLYALKRLRSQFRDDPDLREMFLEEARLAGLLRHPNAVSVLDVGEDKDGPFLLMDFVDGLSVARIIAKTRQAEDLLPLQVCLRIAEQACEGLAAAHGLLANDGTPVSLVHRDVSPQNILVGFDGLVRVTDFGVAKALGGGKDTTSNVLKGKISYMSPEQLRFERVDPRSDLFSLGVVLFEMLAGERLYAEKITADSAHRILHEPPKDVTDHRSDVPPELQQLLFDLLCKHKEGRPESAAEVTGRLQAMIRDLAQEEGPLSIKEFLEERFAELREKEDARRAEAIRLAKVGEATAIHSMEEDTLRERRSRKGWVAIGITAVVAAGIVAYWQWSGGGAAVAGEPTTVASAPAETESATEGSASGSGSGSASGSGPESGSESGSESPSESEPGSEPETPSASESRTQPNRKSRRWRRARQQRGMTGTMSNGAGTDDWWD
jgi:serine/threonine-protein kinase